MSEETKTEMVGNYCVHWRLF